MGESLCATCRNAYYSVLWGEYKCSLYQLNIYGDISKCDGYIPLKKGESVKISQEDPISE